MVSDVMAALAVLPLNAPAASDVAVEGSVTLDALPLYSTTTPSSIVKSESEGDVQTAYNVTDSPFSPAFFIGLSAGNTTSPPGSVAKPASS